MSEQKNNFLSKGIPKVFKFANPLTGFGLYGMGSDTEIYPIFSDGSGRASKILTKTPLSAF